MKVRMLVSIAGHALPDYDMPEFSLAPGDTPDLHDELAEKWIASGLAEKVSRKKPATAAGDQPAADASESN